MKSGDFDKMASYFDTSSSKNRTVFWSGDKAYAGKYAKSITGTIMEDTIGGQVFDGWEALTKQYANGASGKVTYVHLKDYVGAIWEKVEYPIMIERIKKGYITDLEEVFINGK